MPNIPSRLEPMQDGESMNDVFLRTNWEAAKDRIEKIHNAQEVGLPGGVWKPWEQLSPQQKKRWEGILSFSAAAPQGTKAIRPAPKLAGSYDVGSEHEPTTTKFCPNCHDGEMKNGFCSTCNYPA